MVVAQTEHVAYDLMREHDYRFLVAYDGADLSPLDRWPYLGALDRNLYALGDGPAEVSEAPLVVTNQAPPHPARRIEIACDGSAKTVPAGTWLDLTRADPAARLRVSDELAALPLRRYAWVTGSGVARLRCSRAQSDR
jgi:hypothetical protein